MIARAARDQYCQVDGDPGYPGLQGPSDGLPFGLELMGFAGADAGLLAIGAAVCHLFGAAR
jgi:Asp-tRNA(Asn)/Glu-tRNA(Gln) amidotransferase A subunit family amidase